MYRLVREILGLLNSQERKAFLLQQVLVVIMAVCELVAVAAIGPFMALVGNMRLLETNAFLASIYSSSGMQSPDDFLIAAGIAVLLVLASSSAISVLTLWKNAHFASRLGEQLADGLFKYYLHQPWLFHTNHNSADLNAKITGVDTVTQSIVQPLINIVARCAVVVFIAVPLFLYSPKLAISGLAIFGIAYAMLYGYVRQRLMANGVSTSSLNYQRFELRSEAFGGIRDVLLLHRQDSFARPFHEKGLRLSRNVAVNQLLSQFPRYLIELFAYGAIVFLVLYLLRTHSGDLGKILPILAIYALGSFKLLPAFQSIYVSLAQIRSGMGTFQFIFQDLKDSQSYRSRGQPTESGKRTRISSSMELKDIEFSYPSKMMPALHGLTMKIPAHQVVGIVGSSGSGKSTIIDLLLGLIEPDKGEILIDGRPLSRDQIHCWQEALGFVPQSLFLANTSILRNIAFGLSREEIDIDRVNRAVRFAHLDDFVAGLPHGLETHVGERGVQLSGGQRQRIGIARALYNDAEVLILDEATSALDGITERIIMDAIHDFSGSKTIVMIAHRLTTVQKCDLIYFIDQGKVLDMGTYTELFSRNEAFRKMAGQPSSSQ